MHLTAFNTVVAMRYALCIKYNHYAQKCHQGSYKLHGNAPPKISIQQNSKAQYEVGKQHTSDVGEYTQNGSFVMMGDRKEAPRLLKHSLN